MGVLLHDDDDDDAHVEVMMMMMDVAGDGPKKMRVLRTALKIKGKPD